MASSSGAGESRCGLVPFRSPPDTGPPCAGPGAGTVCGAALPGDRVRATERAHPCAGDGHRETRPGASNRVRDPGAAVCGHRARGPCARDRVRGNRAREPSVGTREEKVQGSGDQAAAPGAGFHRRARAAAARRPEPSWTHDESSRSAGRPSAQRNGLPAPPCRLCAPEHPWHPPSRHAAGAAAARTRRDERQPPRGRAAPPSPSDPRPRSSRKPTARLPCRQLIGRSQPDNQQPLRHVATQMQLQDVRRDGRGWPGARSARGSTRAGAAGTVA